MESRKENLHEEMQKMLTEIFGVAFGYTKSYEECIQEMEYLLTEGVWEFHEALLLLNQAAVVDDDSIGFRYK